MRISSLLIVLSSWFVCADAQVAWTHWPPRDYLLKSLVESVANYLKDYHPETGKFGSEPWICQDQNVIFPLAAAWSIEDQNNPYFHDSALLATIAKAGEVLVDEMDENGMWTFRKKDNSTWGQIHMPWTYSRWIRAYQLTREALPEASRTKWERGLKLGFSGIRRYADGRVHNIPTHHAMALYIAGECFDNDDWKQAAEEFMAKVVSEQDSVGFWSEHFGPVVGYNMVYVEALGIYYRYSKDPAVLDALSRAARFHANVLWPNGSSVSAIDERQIYHNRVDVGNVGFSWIPEGRGFLLKQVALYSKNREKTVNGDFAAAMLLYGDGGDGILPVADADIGSVQLGKNDAVIQRRKPWQWAISGYACTPENNRWIQDRQNLVDVYHDELGLIVGGGNTKLQPLWSTFTVGDTSLLTHTPGDESPEFVPSIDLKWTPDSASISYEQESGAINLQYGDVECRVEIEATVRELVVTYRAQTGRRVEAHMPFLYRGDTLTTATGQMVKLTDEPVLLGTDDVGDTFQYGGIEARIPIGCTLNWPVRQHNPYKKDGSSETEAAKLVLTLPFSDTSVQTVHLRLPK